MGRPVLYLLIGYPGAGKTTVARIISETLDAVHLWSDIERHKMFDNPTHSEAESHKLYEALNERTEQLLSEGRSVVFDTNFNFADDRRKLRAIAERHDAETVVVWIIVPEPIARRRSLDSDVKRNGYHTRMSERHFNEIIAKLEPPTEDEKIIKIDGATLDRQTILALVGQYHDADISPS